MRKLTNKGKYKVKNVEKYDGDPDTVTFRSSWERAAFLWADKNPSVIKWNSEEVVVPYIYSLDNRPHRYFVDLYLEFTTGKPLLVEIKPRSETKKPRKGNKKPRKRYLTEAATFVKNQNKWEAANKYAEERGWKFQIWDEVFLRKAKILRW